MQLFWYLIWEVQMVALQEYPLIVSIHPLKYTAIYSDYSPEHNYCTAFYPNERHGAGYKE